MAAPRQRRGYQPETDIVQRIRLAVSQDGRVVLWRLKQGAFRGEDGRMRQFGLVPGASDLIGIVRGTGRFIALEVKTATGRTSAEQDQFLALVRTLGGFGAVVRSVEDAIEAVNKACA